MDFETYYEYLCKWLMFKYLLILKCLESNFITSTQSTRSSSSNNFTIFCFSVRKLKEVIENEFDIPINKIVLLVSGGDCLNDSARVCNYPAGTDTNPIFLFNRQTLERRERPSIMPDYRYNASIGKCFLSNTTLIAPIRCIY